MRHKVRSLKLGKDSAHRKALLKNLATDLFNHEKITTTITKAKFLKSYAEKLITKAKVDNLHNRRIVYKHIRNTEILKKVFEDLGKRFATRNGGYTRLYKLNPRKGDASEMCIIELVEELLVKEKEDKSAKTEA